MNLSTFRFIIPVCLSFIYSPMAFACEKLIPFGDDQVKSIQAQIANAEDNDFDAVLEYGKLMCAKRPYVREFARRIGLASPNASIRSQAILSALMEKEAIVFEVVITEDLSEAQTAFAQATPMISYPVYFRDRDNACLSIYRYTEKKCDPRYTVSVVGEQVDLRHDDHVATLRLDENNMMFGTWTDTSRKSKVSVPITMALD